MSLTHLSPELVNLATGSYSSVLKKLQEEANYFSTKAPNFDFKNFQYNGLRTLLKIIQEYFNEVHAFFLVYKRHKKEQFTSQFELSGGAVKLFKCSKSTNALQDISKSPLARHFSRLEDVSPKRFDQIYDDLLAIGIYFLRQFSQMRRLEVSQIRTDKIVVEQGVAYHPEWREIIKTFFIMDSSELGCFYNRDIAFFWANRWWRYAFGSLHFGRVFITQPLSKSIRTLGNIKLQKNLTYHSSLHMFHWHVMQFIRKFTESPLGHMIAVTDSTIRGVKHGHFDLPRQRAVGFTQDGQLDTNRAHELWDQKEEINCMYLRSGPKDTLAEKCNYTLNLHLFGSGYVALTPDVHSVYLAGDCKKTGVPILVPHYSKAPKRPFPNALQDCLDVYLFLTNGENDLEVEDLIGFVPRRIVLTGDSAGSNLALVLPIVLNEYNRARAAQNKGPIQLPVALGVQYPLAKAIVRPSFSYFMSVYDPFLLFPMILEFQAAYLAPDLITKKTPWFRVESEEKLKQTLLRLQSFESNIYVYPFSYERLSDLSDIAIYVQGAEFDVLIDDAIEIAQMWPGPVTLDIIPKSYHGFNVLRTKKVKRHIKEYLTFIKQHALADPIY